MAKRTFRYAKFILVIVIAAATCTAEAQSKKTPVKFKDIFQVQAITCGTRIGPSGAAPETVVRAKVGGKRSYYDVDYIISELKRAARTLPKPSSKLTANKRKQAAYKDLKRRGDPLCARGPQDNPPDSNNPNDPNSPACRADSPAEPILVPELSAKEFSLPAVDSCGNALTFEEKEAPALGTLSGTAPLLTYQSGHQFGDDKAVFGASNGKDLFSITIQFKVGPSKNEFAGSPVSLAPYRDTLTPAEAAHFANRAAFGDPRIEQIAREQGLKAAIDALFDAIGQADPSEETGLAQEAAERTQYCVTINETGLPANSRFCTTEKPLQSIEGAASYLLAKFAGSSSPLEWLINAQWLHEVSVNFPALINNNNERSRYAWDYVTQIRNLGFRDQTLVENAPITGDQVELQGYCALLYKLATGPGVNLYLNNGGRDGNQNTGNRYGANNEDFARELLQLWSWGEYDLKTFQLSYTESHVAQMREVFAGPKEGPYETFPVTLVYAGTDPAYTGVTRSGSYRLWTWVFDPLRLYPIPAKPEKRVLFSDSEYQQVYSFDQLTALREICYNGNPHVSQRLARLLIGRLTHPDAPFDAAIDPVARILREDNLKLHRATRTILGSSMMFAERNVGSCVIDPLDFYARLFRRFKLPLASKAVGNTQYNMYATLRAALSEQGQRLLGYPTVFGMIGACNRSNTQIPADGSSLLADSSLLSRTNSVNDLLSQLDRIGSQLGFSWDTYLPSAFTEDQVIAELEARAGFTLRDDELAALKTYLTTAYVNATTKKAVVWSTAPAAYKGMKIRGVITYLSTRNEFNRH